MTKVIASIPVNKHTQNHAHDLKLLGFNVTETESELKVEVNGFIEGTREKPVDLSTKRGRTTFVKKVDEGQVLTYTTWVKVPTGSVVDGKYVAEEPVVRSGKYLLGYLSQLPAEQMFKGADENVNLTCLIMKPPTKSKSKKGKRPKVQF